MISLFFVILNPINTKIIKILPIITTNDNEMYSSKKPYIIVDKAASKDPQNAINLNTVSRFSIGVKIINKVLKIALAIIWVNINQIKKHI